MKKKKRLWATIGCGADFSLFSIIIIISSSSFSSSSTIVGETDAGGPTPICFHHLIFLGFSSDPAVVAPCSPCTGLGPDQEVKRKRERENRATAEVE